MFVNIAVNRIHYYWKAVILNHYIVFSRTINDFIIKILDPNLLRKGLLARLRRMIFLEYKLVQSALFFPPQIGKIKNTRPFHNHRP